MMGLGLPVFMVEAVGFRGIGCVFVRYVRA